jgi:hypothetical protein
MCSAPSTRLAGCDTLSRARRAIRKHGLVSHARCQAVPNKMPGILLGVLLGVNMPW